MIHFFTSLSIFYQSVYTYLSFFQGKARLCYFRYVGPLKSPQRAIKTDIKFLLHAVSSSRSNIKLNLCRINWGVLGIKCCWRDFDGKSIWFMKLEDVINLHITILQNTLYYIFYWQVFIKEFNHIRQRKISFLKLYIHIHRNVGLLHR